MTDDNIPESAQDAARLDRLLALTAPAPTVSPMLEHRILADFDRVRMRANIDAVQARRWTVTTLLRRAADAVWPDAPAWKPACAFALAILVGTGAAAFAPLDIPQADDAGAAPFAFDISPDADAGQGL
jgi:hypothetical protein